MKANNTSIKGKEELMKILKGIDLAQSRMLERAKLLDEELVISENGVVKRIKAREIK